MIFTKEVISSIKKRDGKNLDTPVTFEILGHGQLSVIRRVFFVFFFFFFYNSCKNLQIMGTAIFSPAASFTVFWLSDKAIFVNFLSSLCNHCCVYASLRSIRHYSSNSRHTKCTLFLYNVRVI